MKPHKPRSKPISKGIDVCYYDRCHLDFIFLNHKVHPNEILNIFFKNMFIRHDFVGKKKNHFKKTFEIRFNFDLSKVHNYHLVKVLKKNTSHLYFILYIILFHFSKHI
jgi:hypothetical protein